jgi:Lrp/AsnC family transcriptional regulator
MSERLDAIDLKILTLLQRDASASVAEIAEAVGLSQSPCWRRIQRLEQQGYIRERIAVLDRRRLGFNLEVFVLVRFTREGEGSLERFEAAVRGAGEVLECHMLMGDVDFLLRVVTRDVESYERFLRERLSALPGVRSVNSSMALSTVKRTQSLPLELLEVPEPSRR